MASHPSVPPPPRLDLEALARRFRLPVADLSRATGHAVALVPERWARRFRVVPLSATRQELEIATADPLDVDCERTLAFATGRHIRLSLAEPGAIDRRIDELYGPDGDGGGAGEGGPSGQTHEPPAMYDVQHLDNDHEAAPPSPT